MKRKLAIILLTLSCLQLIGCGKANNIERVEINTEVQNEIDENENKQEEQETLLLDGSDQIALIAENKEDWFVEDEWNFYVYTEAEYIGLPQTIYEGCDEKVASFQWIPGEDLDIPDLETALGVLYQGFTIE